MGERDWGLVLAARHYLRQVRELDDEIRSRRKQLGEISSAITALGSPSYDSDPVQTSKAPDAPFVRQLETLMDLDKKTHALIAEREATRNRILDQIDQMEDNRFKILLRSRYAHCERFEACACELHYSLRQTLRLHRQGQTRPVIVHHLIAEGTVDEQVMKALKQKDTSQAALLAALKERRTG